ncbi:uncharacterized protein PHACADRAFT_33457 [Phanerochaete carnosa HHB-10118-sp]|uniref:Uncharacterized protein n=1 Tax=Phanerochaete carnosa (strain HHB-10118-sp) TaxID=650164 RepID=K5VRL3_PHACS|nr:uncharacterized protein PHACADRAFT_33457 [Phanerochaete carnosa HHB-10118-sp]EKM49390.1 hypothetical protein PHACADRAFT_33457 [Phanerochaete carnosa HHB-10118-sp]
MPPYPDEQLPTETLSMQEFVELAKETLTGRLTVPDFVRLVLAGRKKTAAGERRLNINVFKDCVSPADIDNIAVTRDFDSIIGITTNIPLRTSLAVYPAANFRDSLLKSNHLKKTIRLAVSDQT